MGRGTGQDSRRERIRRFARNAKLVSARVETVETVQQALALAADICVQRPVCQPLPAGDSPPGALFDRHTLAAPGLGERERIWLSEACLGKKIKLVDQGLRRYLGGVDMAVTWAQYGIAETGTLVINSTDEDLRLATMISEVHLALLKVDDIHPGAADLAGPLKSLMQGPDNYTAFITGASRTADIERVLTLGVHGPLVLIIVLIGEAAAHEIL